MAGPRTLISTGSPFEADWAWSRVVVSGEWDFVYGSWALTIAA